MAWRKLAVVLLALSAGIALTGCSGINTAQSWSPTSLFLPGLIQHIPASPSDLPTPADPSATILARAN